jgi:hypothetical protein
MTNRVMTKLTLPKRQRPSPKGGHWQKSRYQRPRYVTDLSLYRRPSLTQVLGRKVRFGLSASYKCG